MAIHRSDTQTGRKALLVITVLLVILAIALIILTQPSPVWHEQGNAVTVPNTIDQIRINLQNATSGPTNVSITPNQRRDTSYDDCVQRVLRTEANNMVQAQGLEHCKLLFSR